MKTKEQFLTLLRRMKACRGALAHIEAYPSEEAYPTIADLTEWQIWFLSRRLKKASLELFAKRLGVPIGKFYYEPVYQGSYMHNLPENERKSELRLIFVDDRAYTPAGRKVVNECWRAWCNS